MGTLSPYPSNVQVHIELVSYYSYPLQDVNGVQGYPPVPHIDEKRCNTCKSKERMSEHLFRDASTVITQRKKLQDRVNFLMR